MWWSGQVEGLAGAPGGSLERGWRPEGSRWRQSCQCRRYRGAEQDPLTSAVQCEASGSARRGVHELSPGAPGVEGRLTGAGTQGSAAGAGSQRVGQGGRGRGRARRSDQKPHPGPCGRDLGGAWHRGGARTREGAEPGRARRGHYCARLILAGSSGSVYFFNVFNWYFSCLNWCVIN